MRNRQNTPKEMEVHWRELKSGDVFKAYEKSGPFFMINRFFVDVKEHRQVPAYLGEFGLFKVIRLNSQGILCRRHDPRGQHKYYATIFLYMGPPKRGKTGSHMRPYKIRKLVDRASLQ